MATEALMLLSEKLVTLVDAAANSGLVSHFQQGLSDVASHAAGLRNMASQDEAAQGVTGSQVAERMIQAATSWYNQEYAKESSDYQVQQAVAKVIEAIPAIGNIAGLFYASFAKMNGIKPQFIDPNDNQFLTGIDDHGMTSNETTGQNRATDNLADDINTEMAQDAAAGLPSSDNVTPPERAGTLQQERFGVNNNQIAGEEAPSRITLGSYNTNPMIWHQGPTLPGSRPGLSYPGSNSEPIRQISQGTSMGAAPPGKMGGFYSNNLQSKIGNASNFQPSSNVLKPSSNKVDFSSQHGNTVSNLSGKLPSTTDADSQPSTSGTQVSDSDSEDDSTQTT